ncbi:MAG TPA: hypothetical protein PKM91_09435, partial [Cyclobacteriaceae bacterium]|nr:hypothetical protein [Cyclobacteriaceae bacterium]
TQKGNYQTGEVSDHLSLVNAIDRPGGPKVRVAGSLRHLDGIWIFLSFSTIDALHHRLCLLVIQTRT